MPAPHSHHDLQLPDLSDVQRVSLLSHATRLGDDFASLLSQLARLTDLTEVTGNAAAQLENDHVSGALYNGNTSAFSATHSIHVRIDYQQWRHGYALDEIDDRTGERRLSLHFFDRYGHRLHKIGLNNLGDMAVFRQIVHNHAAPMPASLQDLVPSQDDTSGAHAGQIDVDALRAEWAHAHDHAHFIARQETFDQQRLRKLRLAGKAFAYQVGNESVRLVLQRMSDFGTSILTLVGNAGIVQACYGKIRNIGVNDARLKIMHSGFRLLLREDHIDSVWLAKKPTTDGIITSLELFNRQGTHIASFLGKKNGGQPEPREWREAMMRLMPIFGT